MDSAIKGQSGAAHLFLDRRFAEDIQFSGRARIFLILIIRSKEYQQKMADLRTGPQESHFSQVLRICWLFPQHSLIFRSSGEKDFQNLDTPKMK
jgi:hypothetical protein